jgi:cyclophilin family peptidyl-prolyl cis-trans isomerase
VGKFAMTIILILLGLFLVYVFNNSKTMTTPTTMPANTSTLNLQQNNASQNETTKEVNFGVKSEATTPTPTQEISENTTATIKTGKGDIEIMFYIKDAPNTVANFVKLANQGFYNGVIFHRVIKGFMIQGGDPTGTGRGGPGYQFADELNPSSQSYQAGYKKGVVAMANSGPDTNGSQFFIMLEDYPLDRNYTIFGKVAKGQEVVDEIGNAQTGANDRPVDPVKMTSVIIN